MASSSWGTSDADQEARKGRIFDFLVLQFSQLVASSRKKKDVSQHCLELAVPATPGGQQIRSGSNSKVSNKTINSIQGASQACAYAVRRLATEAGRWRLTVATVFERVGAGQRQGLQLLRPITAGYAEDTLHFHLGTYAESLEDFSDRLLGTYVNLAYDGLPSLVSLRLALEYLGPHFGLE